MTPLEIVIGTCITVVLFVILVKHTMTMRKNLPKLSPEVQYAHQSTLNMLYLIDAVILVVGILFWGHWDMLAWQKYQQQQQLHSQYAIPVECPSEEQVFTLSVKGQTVTYTFTTPKDRQWAMDYGDGTHSQVYYTQVSQPYTLTHVYAHSTVAYTATFLVYNPTAMQGSSTNCEGRSHHMVLIP